MTTPVLACWLGVVLGGCATERGAPLDWEHGARRASVVERYDAGTPRERLPACLAALPPAELSRYARLRYRDGRLLLSAVAELPADGAAAGAMVELYPQDCAQGRLARIGRILPPAS
jgi:hypothetical protein